MLLSLKMTQCQLSLSGGEDKAIQRPLALRNAKFLLWTPKYPSKLSGWKSVCWSGLNPGGYQKFLKSVTFFFIEKWGGEGWGWYCGDMK